MSIVSVFASLTATVLVSTGAPKALIASVAAIPAACTALQRIVNFRGRSHWYFQQAAALKALAVSLRYASTANLEDFARLRANLEIEGEQRWAQMGSGRDPSSTGAKQWRPARE